MKRALNIKIDHVSQDKSGRLSYICTKLQGEKIAFVSVYAPSVYNLTFFPWLQNKLLALSNYALAIGADNNAVFHLQKDRSTQTFSIPQQASIAFNNFTNDLGLSDVWRLQNTSKGYTCFSSYHKTLSRIDHILCSHKITSAFTQIQILPALLSDHNFLKVNLEILPRISKIFLK